MSLELRKTSRFFYCRYQNGDGRKVARLDVEVQGTPPPGLSLRKRGDAAFEKSRRQAMLAEERLLEALQADPGAKGATKRTPGSCTAKGRKSGLRVEQLFEVAKAAVSDRPWVPEYEGQVHVVAEKFVAYLKEKHPRITFADEVTRSEARAFLKRYQEQSKCGNKTLQGVRVAMQGLYSRAIEEEALESNPFQGLRLRVPESQSKQPFTDEELTRILEAAKVEDTPDLYELVLVAASTGLRLGDCCRLLRSAVSIEGKTLSINPSKTPKAVVIPVLPPLQEVLRARLAQPPDSPFLFPQAASLHRSRKGYYSSRFRKILKRLGILDKKPRAVNQTHRKGESGCRKAPKKSFHGLKTTWISRTLRSGMPLPSVLKITGNRSADLVIRHYYANDTDETRRQMLVAMPEAVGGIPAPENTALESCHRIRRAVEKLTSRNLATSRKDLLAELERLADLVRITKIERAG